MFAFPEDFTAQTCTKRLPPVDYEKRRAAFYDAFGFVFSLLETKAADLVINTEKYGEGIRQHLFYELRYALTPTFSVTLVDKAGIKVSLVAKQTIDVSSLQTTPRRSGYGGFPSDFTAKFLMARDHQEQAARMAECRAWLYAKIMQHPFSEYSNDIDIDMTGMDRLSQARILIELMNRFPGRVQQVLSKGNTDSWGTIEDPFVAVDQKYPFSINVGEKIPARQRSYS